MSGKWSKTHGESGILRKSEFKEKKEELFVFGYTCKLFRDDEKAIIIDQGKHLIPWMGDESLKIDRYDARGALHDLSRLEAPPGGYDWRVELTKTELDVEQLCDEERYRALHTDEDEEEMYKEEELKRLHKAGYGQVGFNYDTPAEPEPVTQPMEVDEPFQPSPTFKALFSAEILFPDSQKQNAIIEKTAKFIANQGAQMEILIKAKQGDNPQFKFMNKDSTLHPYYTALIGLVKAGKWPEQKPEPIEEKQPENEEYLHPSLASTVIESAPSIPSIHYKPSADCDYTLLMYKIAGVDPELEAEPAPGEEPPPGTRPLHSYTASGHKLTNSYEPPAVMDHAMISKGPVVYNKEKQEDQPAQTQPAYQQYAAYYQQYVAYTRAHAANMPTNPPQTKPVPLSLNDAKKRSTGLSLMNHYNTDSDSDGSDSDRSLSNKGKVTIASPPEDVKTVIDKMAAYVARNGDEFAEIVRAKNDPRFTFLEPNNEYHAYYKKLMQQKRGIANGSSDSDKKNAPTVSFSIKKQKEPEPILPKPALPYESSSDDESDVQTDKQEEKQEPKTNIPQIQQTNNMPPIVVYKMEEYKPSNNLPTIKAIETVPKIQKPIVIAEKKVEIPKVEEKAANDVIVFEIEDIMVKEKSVTPVLRRERVYSKEKEYDKEKVYEKEYRKHKSKHKDRKKVYRSKSEARDSRKSERRSVERDRKKERERVKDKKRAKPDKDELESEIISLEDNSDEMIDLTGDQSDCKVENDAESERAKQLQRRRRAAEFLKKVGVEPPPAALATNSLASAMVDTLESIRKKKAEEEEKRRRREKRRHRDRYDEEYKSRKRRKRRSSEENSDYEGKKKKRKSKKTSKSKRKKRLEESEEEIQDHPLNIDLSNTLKELRNASPSKELLQDIDENTQISVKADSSSDESEERRDKKKEEREYSEGEWSSDSEDDSVSTAVKDE